MGRVKYCFLIKKDIQRARTNILRLSNSKAPIKGKRFLPMSSNVNVVTERARRDNNANVTLMAQGFKQNFILHFAT